MARGVFEKNCADSGERREAEGQALEVDTRPG